MKNWIRKYWWLVIIFFIALPFLLNFAVTRYTPFDWRVAGEPKDWIVFWGAYISSISSLIMVYYTYRIIKHSESLERGKLIFRLLLIDKQYALEFKNIGKSTVILESLIFNNEFIKSMCIQKKGSTNKFTPIGTDIEGTITPTITYEENYMQEKFGAFANGKKYINPEEEKYIALIGVSSITDAINECVIHIKGVYRTNNNLINFDEKFCIGELAVYHIPPSKQSKEDKLISVIEKLSKTLSNKEII